MRSTVAGARWQGAAGFARKAGETGHVGHSHWRNNPCCAGFCYLMRVVGGVACSKYFLLLVLLKVIAKSLRLPERILIQVVVGKHF